MGTMMTMRSTQGTSRTFVELPRSSGTCTDPGFGRDGLGTLRLRWEADGSIQGLTQQGGGRTESWGVLPQRREGRGGYGVGRAWGRGGTQAWHAGPAGRGKWYLTLPRKPAS